VRYLGTRREKKQKKKNRIPKHPCHEKNIIKASRVRPVYRTSDEKKKKRRKFSSSTEGVKPQTDVKKPQRLKQKKNTEGHRHSTPNRWIRPTVKKKKKNKGTPRGQHKKTIGGRNHCKEKK